MNKTIIININGIVFHIEEDAYEVLKSYMTEVKRHFIDSADSLEITTDIENRIAEMFTDILVRDGKQVIVEHDVREVVAQMGTIEDFASADEEGEPTVKSKFAEKATTARRLFRDPDDRLVSGVCAGIANYFEIQAVWIRLAFVLGFVLWGTGLVAYIILWIVVPKAVTRADRMAMKGEPLDLQGFKRNFEDEIRTVGGRLNDLHHEARPTIYKTRDFVGDFFGHLRNFINGAGKLLLKILGVCIMLSAVGFIIALLVLFFAYYAYDSHNITHLFPFSIINHEYNLPFMLGALLVLTLPLLGIVLLAVRLLFDRVSIGRTTGLTLFALWIGAVCLVTFFSIRIASEFRSSGTLSQAIDIKPTGNSTYYLKLNDLKRLSAEDSAELDIKHTFMGKQIVEDSDDDFDMDNNMRNSIDIYIEKADVPKPVIVEEFSARGRTKTDALKNAGSITYNFTQQDSIIKFDQYLESNNRKWREQRVRLTLKVPLNATLVVDDKLDRYLNGVDVSGCQRDNKNENGNTATFVMTDNGLQCKVDTAIVAKPDSLTHQ